MAKIQHIAIFSDNPEKLAEFYADVYGMQVTGRSKGDVWVTDGYMNVALIMRKQEKSPKGIHHFGFMLEPDEKEGVYTKMKARGLDPYDPRAENPNVDRPFVEDAGRDIDGNRFDISTSMREMSEEQKRMEEYRKKTETETAKA